MEQEQKLLSELKESTEKVNILKSEGMEIIKDLVEKTADNNEASKKVREVIIDTSKSAENCKTQAIRIKEHSNPN